MNWRKVCERLKTEFHSDGLTEQMCRQRYGELLQKEPPILEEPADEQENEE